MLWFLSSLLLAGKVCCGKSSGQGLSQNSWPAPIFLVEIMQVESVALEDSKTFFPFFDVPEAVYSSSLEVARIWVCFPEPGALAFVESSLALHAATPKIEAFYHHYTEVVGASARHKECGSWVDWYGTVVCDVESLAQVAGLDTIDSTDSHPSNYTRPKILPFDHIYPPPDNRLETPPRSAILYASLDSPNFRELHTYLMRLANNAEPRIEYIVRHVRQKTSTRYSVSLDLKKMDYLALDDRHLSTQQDDPSQLIMDSADPLLTLTHLSQNFPKYVTTLARRVTVKENIAQEVHENQLRVQGGANAMWLNGVSVAEKDLNAFGLLRLLKKERSIMTDLTSLDLERGEAMDLLTHPILSAAQESKMFWTGGDVIIWWNDLEKDRSSHSARTMHGIIERGFPFRFGVVPIVETEDGARMARLIYFLLNNFGRKVTMNFLKRVAHPFTVPGAQRSFQWSTIRGEYDALMAAEANAGTPIDQISVDFESAVSGTNSGARSLDGAQSYNNRLSTTLSASSAGHGFINGKHVAFDENFLRNMQTEISRQLMHLQEEIYEGHLTDEDNERISNYFFDLPTTARRRNKYVVPSKDDLDIISLPELLPRSGPLFAPSSFVYPTESEVIPVTLFVVADLNAKDGLEFVKEALTSMGKESSARLAFIHNPATEELSQGISISSIFAHLVDENQLSKIAPARLLQSLDGGELASEPDESTPQVSFSTIRALKNALELDHLGQNGSNKKSGFLEACQWFVRSMGIEEGQNGIVINGRIIGAISPKEFLAADFQALQEYELLKRIQPVLAALENIRPGLRYLDRATIAHVVSMASSVISSIQLPDPSENYRTLESQYTVFEVGDNSTALYQIAVIVDPLSETAQKWSSLLKWISYLPDTYLEIRLNPTQYSEVPLKKFFRYNLQTSLSFDETGQELLSQTVFEDLPLEPIYTLAMDVPSSWLVRPREAMYDLDNIQLGNLAPEDSSVDTIFDLDYIVVEGHARDTTTQSPPRGLQLQLVSSSVPIDDTQVVANLGYFQFKTKPGVFKLEIREGRGRDIYVTDSVGNEGWDSPSVNEVGNEITVTSFEGQTLYPRFSRLPGMEREDVLAEEEEEESSSVFGSMFSSVKSLFKATEETAVDEADEQADINIFTVASGLLYERFVGIMILSVLRNTKSTVKFWFIENFLSPSFLEFIPHLAEAYNFKYELKQRIIWAYKILFLDVLFPMDLKKVIFVDADQIVRADLQELVDLDLHGAPYGYTPMGDDNEAMEGFRFWKTGYWADFLQGKPYHIRSAGDILRGSYQQLSMDPNSLANLDQDLPNNLQREVPIHSLHEDWLWVSSKDRLHRAKTIDLCQNPLTKEPKLDRARQIPEWEEYDSEIAKFARKLAEEGKIRSRIAAADANALAQTASGVVPANPESGGANKEEAENDEKIPEMRDEL
ncbi:UDP-glucose:glycoprotein glucosyltransferase-domain-containing protein [Lentinula guzmanii]|uniref:UDP-glucose:glycoprotein glucosyltransferase-domain-containing protein n=1 Tax=Lentinula guzmanii TaxID=2804957 RepID=A0AA38MYF9_9AGAR|nr:UDP-glucose:glycoprotein glucosyltransferase-domain-containing protein [Lentinula guzmanii]